MTNKISGRRTVRFLLAVLIFLAGVFARPTLSRIKADATSFATQIFQRQQPQPHSDDDSPYDPLAYERMSSQYALIAKTRRIVFLGDSRVEGAEWSDLFDRQDISNRGISGDTTTGVLRRLRTSIPNPISLCVIQLGVNDLSKGCPVESVISNYADILNDLMTRVHASVIVTSIISTRQPHDGLNPAIRECNRQLEQLATRRGALFVDINGPLGADGMLSATYSNDGIHINGEGYQQVCGILAPYLNRYEPEQIR
jgi:lysophospholipase L1-like esterase